MPDRNESAAPAELAPWLNRYASRRTLARYAAATAGIAGMAAVVPWRAGRAAQSTPEAMFENMTPGNDTGTLIFQIPWDGNSMHPLIADGAGGWAMDLIYQSLLRSNPETGELDGLLAESWEVAEDGVTWTFTLREGVTWHDGTPFTAADVVFSYELAREPDVNSYYYSQVTENLDTITALDDRTVVMTAKDVNSEFLELGLGWLAARHIWEGVAPADVGSDPGSTAEDLSRVLGTGPFRLTERVPQDHTTVERYDGYWGGTPHVDAVIVQYVPDWAAGEQIMRTGDHDYSAVTFLGIDALRDVSHLEFFEFFSLDLVQIGLNLASPTAPFFADVRVRQALMHALDRQAIVDGHYQGYAAVADTVLLPNMWAMDAEGFTGPAYPYDPARAAELLDEAGWTVGDDGIREQDGVKFAFTFADNDYFGGILSIAQEMWRAVGLDVTVELTTWEVVGERLDTGEWDASIIYLNCRGSGFRGLNTDLNSVNAPNNGNYASYSNERVDELLGLIRAELDQEAQIPYFTELQNIYFEELPYLPIAHDFDLRAVNTRVHNLFPNPYSMVYNAQDWWIDPQ